MTENTTDLAQLLLKGVQARLPSFEVAGLAPEVARALRTREAADHEAAARRADLLARVAACAHAGFHMAVRLATEAAAPCGTGSGDILRLVPCATGRTSQRLRQRPRHVRVRFGLTRPSRVAR